jgi:hypothetical protein
MKRLWQIFVSYRHNTVYLKLSENDPPIMYFFSFWMFNATFNNIDRLLRQSAYYSFCISKRGLMSYDLANGWPDHT